MVLQPAREAHSPDRHLLSALPLGQRIRDTWLRSPLAFRQANDGQASVPRANVDCARSSTDIFCASYFFWAFAL